MIERLDYTTLPPGHTQATLDHPKLCACAECLSAAWAHYKATSNPPRIVIAEAGIGWRFVVDGARYLRADFVSRAAALKAAWRRYDERVALARLWGRPGYEWEHWPAAYYWTDDEAGEALRGLNGGPTPPVLSMEPRALLDRLLRLAKLARECELYAVGLDIATFTAARTLTRPGAEGRSVIEEALGLTGLAFTCADDTPNVVLESACRTAATQIAVSISMLSDRARAQGVRRPLVFFNTSTNTLMLIDRDHPGLSSLGPRCAGDAVLASAGYAPDHGIAVDGGDTWR